MDGHIGIDSQIIKARESRHCRQQFQNLRARLIATVCRLDR